MKSYIFSVKIEPDEFEDGRPAFHGYCPALPGCHTWGYTHEETLHNIQEAVELYVDHLHAEGRPIPIDPDLQVGAVELTTAAVVVNV